MALDARILLQGQTPDLLRAVQGGLSVADEIRMQPLRRALAQSQATTASQGVAKTKGQFVNKFAQGLLEVPEEQRAAVIAQSSHIFKSMGIDPSRFTDLSDASIGSVISATSAFGSSDPQVNLQRGQGAITTDQGGASAFQTPVFNPMTGQVEVVTSPIAGQLASRLGETPEQQTARTLQEERGKSNIRLAQEESLIPVQASQTQAKKEAESKVARSKTTIAEGLEAAKGIPTLKRSIALLDSVKTGGFANASFRAKQLFGIEGADEGELSSNLGQAVLGDLRATFGAAFTEKEGKRLERIRARFGSNSATNKRLLGQSLQIASEAAKRAQGRAIAEKDFATAQELEDLISFEFNFEEEAPQVDESLLEFMTPEERALFNGS